MHWDGPPLEAWAPWRPDEVARRLAGAHARWYVVGGWAIDLFLGRETRAHEDTEIATLRTDLDAIRAQLREFVFHAVGDGEVRALAPGEQTPADKHQNWLLDRDTNEWRLDVMLEPGDADTWVYRRDPSLRAPRAQLIARTREGIPYLAPEAQLLFKAKNVRDKDQLDFDATATRLDPAARIWLRDALERFHPGHAWIASLR